MKTPLYANSLRTTKTKYDYMVDYFTVLVLHDNNSSVAKFADDINTMEAAEFLNSPCVSDPAGAVELAIGLYLWKASGKSKPAWLNKVRDEDLASLDTEETV